MPEPSLLETLRQEHRPRPVGPLGRDFCLDCKLSWPCPVAQYIERAEALAKAVDDYSDVRVDDANDEWYLVRVALAAYREGT